MTNIQAINLLKGLEQSLDDYCELNDEGKTAFRMAITALEVFGNSEQLPSAQSVARDINVLSNDLISRQDAIDQLHQSYNLLDAERRLEDMPSAQRWIPVTERLPEEAYPVIVTWKNDDPASYYQYILGKHYAGVAHYKNGKWYWYSSTTEDVLMEYGRCDSEEFDEAIMVLAWMPLPEPYREEGEQ